MHEAPGNQTISLTGQVRFRAVGEEGVLVHLESGHVIVVNEVALFIVEQLKEARAHDDLVTSVASEFNVSRRQAAADLDDFLSELDRENILVRTQDTG